MKVCLLTICLIGFFNTSFSQQNKPVIDSTAIHNWVQIGPDEDVAISNDGLYMTYSTVNVFHGIKDLIVQSVDGSWKRTYRGATRILFYANNKSLIFQENDTICFLTLGKDIGKRIPGVVACKTPLFNGHEERGVWLACQLKGDDGELGMFYLV